MLLIQDILVSDEIIEEQFVCNLNACKGACCWEGDFGAPLTTEELHTLETIYDDVKPFLTAEGRDSIKNKGLFTYYKEAKEYGTTLMENESCVFVSYDKLGIARCGIERAYKAGATGFKKPISCHLYPIRIAENRKSGFVGLNYDQWDICSTACELGKKEQMPVFRFVKEALIRKFDRDFYDELEKAASFITKSDKST